MWEKWEQQYTDHLPLHYNGLHFYVTNYNISIHQTTLAGSDIAKPYQFISNHKAKIISFFIWQRGAWKNMFEVKN